jgi:pSer/pThr/pTyr-binding forkhead associated (FHA) protein
VYCPECGHHNREVARFCVRCGASLLEPDAAAETTMSFTPVDVEGESTAVLDAPGEGAALVIRAGGGREGEQFAVTKDRITVGRAPSSDVFLDDVTVSREHAVLERRDGVVHLTDLSSLNGTYVNRARVDSVRLGDGDELQIGKYRLTYIER